MTKNVNIIQGDNKDNYSKGTPPPLQIKTEEKLTFPSFPYKEGGDESSVVERTLFNKFCIMSHVTVEKM